MAGTGFERSVRVWLHAYPPRWRDERSDELVAVLADLAPPDARRVDARTALDLLRAGWATRWRLRPPLHHWVAYRFLGRRIPPAHRAWARDDIAGRWFPVRRMLSGLWPLSVPLAAEVASPADDVMTGWWALLLLLGLVAAVGTADAERARAVERHLTLDPGEPVVAGSVVRGLGPRRRLEARSALGWAVAVLVILVVISTAAVLLAPLGWTALPEPVPGGTSVEIRTTAMGTGRRQALVPLATAAVIGLVVAVVGATLARRALRDIGYQPHRVLHRVDRSGRSGAVVVVGLVGAVAVNEATGAMALWLSPVVGIASLAVLPLTVALAVLASRQPDEVELAATDLWVMAFRGRPPGIDEPVLEPQPATWPVALDAVVRHPVPRDPPFPPFRGHSD